MAREAQRARAKTKKEQTASQKASFKQEANKTWGANNVNSEQMKRLHPEGPDSANNRRLSPEEAAARGTPDVSSAEGFAIKMKKYNEEKRAAEDKALGIVGGLPITAPTTAPSVPPETPTEEQGAEAPYGMITDDNGISRPVTQQESGQAMAIDDEDITDLATLFVGGGLFIKGAEKIGAKIGTNFLGKEAVKTAARAGPATEGQINWMRKLKLPVKKGITFDEATKAISAKTGTTLGRAKVITAARKGWQKNIGKLLAKGGPIAGVLGIGGLAGGVVGKLRGQMNQASSILSGAETEKADLIAEVKIDPSKYHENLRLMKQMDTDIKQAQSSVHFIFSNGFINDWLVQGRDNELDFENAINDMNDYYDELLSAYEAGTQKVQGEQEAAYNEARSRAGFS